MTSQVFCTSVGLSFLWFFQEDLFNHQEGRMSLSCIECRETLSLGQRPQNLEELKYRDGLSGPQWTVAPRSPCCDWLSSLSAQRLQGRPQAIDQPPLGTAWTRHTRQTRTNADTFTCNRREAGESQGSRHPTFCRACFSVHCLAFLRKTGLLYLNSED